MPPYVVFVIYFNDISDFFSLAKSLNKGERKGSQFQKYQKFSFSHTHTLDIVTVHVIFKLHPSKSSLLPLQILGIVLHQ